MRVVYHDSSGPLRQPGFRGNAVAWWVRPDRDRPADERHGELPIPECLYHALLHLGLVDRLSALPHAGLLGPFEEGSCCRPDCTQPGGCSGRRPTACRQGDWTGCAVISSPPSRSSTVCPPMRRWCGDSCGSWRGSSRPQAVEGSRSSCGCEAEPSGAADPARHVVLWGPRPTQAGRAAERGR